MPPPSSRMTKNQERNLRYRPGKAAAEDVDYESESEDESDDNPAPQSRPIVPPPKVSTFPARKKLAVDVGKGNQIRSGQPQAQARKQEQDLEGFVTASDSSSEDDDDDAGANSSSEEESSEEEESSSDDEPKRPMLAPKFIPKAQRNKQIGAQQVTSTDDGAAEEERRRQEKANELLQSQIERDAAARAAGRRGWDDDDNAVQDEVDDTDGLDPEAEKAAWKLRELKRVRRDRSALVEKEKEREEVERRKNLSAEEREAEDREFLEQQQSERDGRGKMAFMQKYHHKGAFFQGDAEQDEEVKAALSRDLAGARYVDETTKDTLPEYMRIRDMSNLGKKGRSKYKDLKAEDTGRWGDFRDKRKHDGLDDRFRSDDSGFGGRERTGANTAPVGERRAREDDGYRDRDEKRAKYG